MLCITAPSYLLVTGTLPTGPSPQPAQNQAWHVRLPVFVHSGVSTFNGLNPVFVLCSPRRHQNQVVFPQ